jgi:hypothetical protein
MATLRDAEEAMRGVSGAAFRAFAIGALALGLAWVQPAQGEPYAVGSSIEPLALADQHGVERRVDAATRGLLLSRDMDGGGFVREALASEGAARLEKAGAVYVADVSRMPGLIRRMIAIPRMRGRGYPVLLDTEGAATARFPAEAGKASWIRLEGLRIAEIRILASAEDVTAALASAALPPGE